MDSTWTYTFDNNPVNWIAPWGLEIVIPHKTDMHDSQWGDTLLGNSKSVHVNEQGCYAAGFSSVATVLTDTSITPTTLHEQKNINFLPDSPSMQPNKAANNLGLEFDYWTKEKQGNLEGKINELHEDSTAYGILAQVPYNSNGDLHWVGINGPSKDGYISVTGTSKFDYNSSSRPSSWIITENSILIPTSEIVKINTFTIKKNK